MINILTDVKFSAYLLIFYIIFLFNVTHSLLEEYIKLNSSSSVFCIKQNDLAEKPSPNPDEWRKKRNEAPLNYRNQPSEKKGLACAKQLGRLVLEPYYVAGLTDAEGCFSIYFYEDRGVLKLKCEFTLGLEAIDKPIIVGLLDFFGVGFVRQRDEDFWIYRVQADWELYFVILPFFEQYPLLNAKRKDFLFFKEMVLVKYEGRRIMQSNIHRSRLKVLIANFVYTYFQFTEQRGEREYSLQDIQKHVNYFDNTLPLDYWNVLATCSLITLLTPFASPDPWYVTGFCEGDGGCSVSITPQKVIHTYTACASNKGVLVCLQKFWGAGKIYFVDLKNQNPNSKPHWRLLINPILDLVNLYKNHFAFYPMFGTKQEMYKIFTVVVKAVRKGEHLNPAKRMKLYKLVVYMNKQGKRRRSFLNMGVLSSKERPPKGRFLLRLLRTHKWVRSRNRGVYAQSALQKPLAKYRLLHK